MPNSIKFLELSAYCLYGFVKMDHGGTLLQSTVDINDEDDLCLVEIQCRGARLAIQETNI